MPIFCCNKAWSLQGENSLMVDVLLKNGLIIDGSGAPAFTGDIALKGDTIQAIGSLGNLDAKLLIDAQGLVVAPGFVDVHTHADAAVFVDNRMESQIRQGVTTQLAGLCGYSMAPCTESTQANTQIMSPQLGKAWNHFSDYLDDMQKTSPSTNVASLVGHGALRLLAMDNVVSRAATQDEISIMVRELEKAIEQGAFGMSSGLEYFPGKGAERSEIEALCGVLGRHGVPHAPHVRNRDKYALSGFIEVLEIARNTKSKLQISHVNPKYGRSAKMVETLLACMDFMEAEGCDISLDVMPTPYNFTAAKAHLPAWAHDLSKPDLMAHLRSRTGREALRINPTPIWALFDEGKWDHIALLTSGPATASYVGQTLAAIAEDMNCSGWDAYCRLLLEEGDNFDRLFFLGNSFMFEDTLRLLQHPKCAVCSDSFPAAMDGPLKDICIGPNAYTWISDFLSDFILKAKAMSLEEAIRRISSLPAQQIGISDRGTLKEGNFADVVLFDVTKIKSEFSLAKPKVYTDAIRYVFVNGKMAMEDGKRTTICNGQVLRQTKRGV